MDDLYLLPRRVARKLAHGKDDLAEELESVGNLALVQALQAFDPAASPLGEAGRAPFCAQRVRWAMLRFLNKERRHRPDPDTPVEQVVDQRSENSSLRTNKDLEVLLRQELPFLSPLDCAILVLYRRDALPYALIALRVGISYWAVCRRMKRIARRLARRLARRDVPGSRTPSGKTTSRALLVGTVRLRQRHGNHNERIRMIKVRQDGPRHRRWIAYARYLWELHHGPVPAGQQVIHRNGNGLDDRLENLALGVPRTRLESWMARHPDLVPERYQRTRQGARQHNQERALFRSTLGLAVASRWYLVDHQGRQILGSWQRQRDAYLALGIRLPERVARQNGSSKGAWASTCAGWPELPPLEALTLAALAESGPLDTRQLAMAIERLCQRLAIASRGHGSTLHTICCRLRQRHFLVSQQMGRHPGRHQITPQALAARQEPCWWASCTGREVQPLLEDGYQMVTTLPQRGA